MATVTLIFMSLWWNRFIGAGSDGLVLHAAQRILHGDVPYRDFYFVAPPLRILKGTALVRLFGEELLVLRAFAVFERVLLSVLLFLWLARLFPLRDAALSSIVGVIVLSGDIADTVSFAPCEVALTGVAAALCATSAVGRKNAWSQRALATASGLLAAATFLTKQTSGLGFTLVLAAFFGIILLPDQGARRAAQLLTCFALGWLAPVAAVTTWLSTQGALAQLIDQVFRDGPSSKGPLLYTLLRPIRDGFCTTTNLAYVIPAAVLIAVIFRQRRLLSPPAPVGLGRYRDFATVAACVGTALACAVVAGYNLQPTAVTFLSLRWPQLTLTFLTLCYTFFLAAYYTVAWFRNSQNQRVQELWLLGAFCFSSSYMYAISFTPYEPIAFPGCAALLSFAVAARPNALRAQSVFALYAGATLVIFSCTTFKLVHPYAWVNWRDPPVAKATRAVWIPGIRGLRLSDGTLNDVTEILNTISHHTSPGEPIYAFPYLPLFYALSHRYPATFGIVHWFDVASDRLAVRDAMALRRRQPSVVVYQDVSEFDSVRYEGFFRNNRYSGQRILSKEIESLIGSYKLCGVYGPRSVAIRVYVRKKA